MGLLIFLGSLLLGAVLLPLGFAYGLMLCFWKRHIGKAFATADKKLLVLATAFDKYGNVVCAELFNATLIKKESKIRFGNISQTISQVIGYNILNGTLSRTGKVLNAVLNFFQKDHALKAIRNTEL